MKPQPRNASAIPSADPCVSSKSIVPILTFHNIATSKTGVSHAGLYLTPEKFRRQLSILAFRGYRGVSMDEGLPYLLGQKSGKVVILTFDDGYQDNLENAVPILLSFGFTATCYLVSDHLGGFNQWDAELLGVRKPLMDAESVRRWLDAGMGIGAHTCTHPHLPAVSSAQKHREMIDSKARLETLFDREIAHLAYPYGEYDDECLEIVRNTGYATAVTTRRGGARRGDPLLSLPRLGNSGKKPTLVFFARTFVWI